MANMMIDEHPVQVSAGRVTLEGNLSIPDVASGVVLFAHGSGSGRHSPRNRFVAQELVSAGLGTLLIDLLTEDEDCRGKCHPVKKATMIGYDDARKVSCGRGGT